ncbi:fluoride efflux transporter CrcB [Deinococcus irradiatisoli]|uniref:Fluoride-specific ion channel FluC n=1 Tax=Deinococcus irradiatisoli TaxID=2202254 RepID=A0A2Z3JK49_9DEIO|nr:fluoride efflux transporter CrcB [Deinococcus irradiatisoli]AWN22298.1 fluoride efflux transporter CrcB [Deinococcus irradiatisoli]
MLLGVTLQAAIWVALGGAAGALTRYGLGGWLTLLTERSGWATFPLATLLINVSGSFLLGVVLAFASRGIGPPELRLALGVGFLGAYTTFSTFSVDLDNLLTRGEGGKALLYLLGNVGLGLAAALAGRWLVLRWL